jgi:DNA/RNA-binding domain of Phe-tRNA-synthetase-like protein
MLKFSASNIIKEKISGLKLGLLLARQVKVIQNDPQFEQEFQILEDFLKDKFADRRPAEDEIVGHTRRMYRCIGWEPTRYRPSSEALARRILKGKSLYRVNNLVDYGNIVSARFHLPMGLYDVEKINGAVIVDVGKEDENYRGISRSEIHANGKMILRDKQGIFGNPTADSLRTSITPKTTSALAVFFCPPEVCNEYIKQVLAALEKYYIPFTGKDSIEKDIIVL